MNNVKNFIKENKGIVIIFVLTISVALGLFFYNKANKTEYLDKNLTDEEAKDISYIKKNYQVNEYQNVTIELIDLLNDYYRSYVNKLTNHPEEAYEMLTEESKKDFGNNFEEFSKYVKKIKTLGLQTSKVSEYRTNNGINKSYDIIDTEGNRFTIYEKSIWDYEISFKGKK